MWQGIQVITNYKTTSPACDSDASLPDVLNDFYARFKQQNNVAARKTIPPPNDQLADVFVPQNNDHCPRAEEVYGFMRHIKTQLPPSLDPLQFVYRPNRFTDDAITTTLHLALTYLDNKDSYSGHSLLFIDGFLDVHLTENFTWSLNTSSISKKAQQRLYFLRRLRKAHLPPHILTMFYRGTIESILSSCITAWFGNCT
ncbi:hypothetical protein QTP70_022599, partial [Hemibagrus guttatus]